MLVKVMLIKVAPVGQGTNVIYGQTYLRKKGTGSSMKVKQKLLVAFIIFLFLLSAAGSLFAIADVEINYNLADYLQEDTDTKKALEIIEEQFGLTTDLKIMIPNISAEEAAEVQTSLSEIEDVLTVSFNEKEDKSYKDGNALFTLLIDGDEYSATARQVVSEAKKLLESYPDARYSGTAVEKQSLREAISEEMIWILGIALMLVVVILLITAGSWLEPVVLLLSSGVAVLINMGTNLIMGEISYITNSIAAILQLALSIDYSIVLLHTYRSSLANHAPGFETMLQTVKSVLRPVLASGLTTMAGLIALLFMSFKIGFDLGIVLLKGIFLSLVTALVFFPAILLWFEPAMQKTRKKGFVPKGAIFSKLANKCGWAFVGVFVVVLIFGGVLQGGVSYAFSDTQGSEPAIEEVFGKNSTAILVYKNEDAALEEAYIDRLGELTKEDGAAVLVGATGYSNTIDEKYDLEKVQETLGLSEENARLLYTIYALENGAEESRLSAAEFISYAKELLERDETVAAMVGEDTLAAVDAMLSSKELMESKNTAQEFVDGVGKCLPGAAEALSVETIGQFYMLYFNTFGSSEDMSITGRDFVAYMIYACSANPQMAAQFPETMIYGLQDLVQIDAFFQDEDARTSEDMLTYLNDLGTNLLTRTVSMESHQIEGLYVKYMAENVPELITPVTAEELLDFVLENMETNELMQMVMTEEDKRLVYDAKDLLDSAKELFSGTEYNRVLLTLDLPNEGTDTERFMVQAKEISEEIFGEDAYLAGTIPSTYDLFRSFEYDNTLISTITIISIFLIVMILFKSLSLPILLVMVIQGAIWLAMAIMNVTGTTVFFMSYIMATCILMGATIDYGILMSSNYIVLRQTEEPSEALKKAVEGAMPTVFTSGVILVVAGLIISVVSSQRSISSAGLLIGVGAAMSTLFITLALPALLQKLDGFVLKLTMKH